MKKTLSILLTLAMLVSLSVPAFAATTDKTNSGYVVVTEDFSAVTNHNKVSKDVNGGTDVTSIGNQFYKNSRTNTIGNSNWVFKTPNEYNPGNADAYVSEDGALKINGGGASFTTNPTRLISVYYNDDYSKVGNNFKITYDFKKSVNNGAAVKFMLSDDVKSYYALNMETGTGANVWNLYKVSGSTVTILKSSNETISTTTNKDGTGGTDAGTITVVYDNGTISWDIVANRFSGPDMEYHNTGSYTDESPFTSGKIGFSANSGSFNTFVTFDNVKFSYSVPCLDEDFSSLTANGVANTGAKQRTQITGTDFYITSRTNPLSAKLTASAIADGNNTSLKLLYNASYFTFPTRVDFAEYRGDYSGLGDDYTISFDYTAGGSRNGAYLFFGLPANADDNFSYTDYYMFIIDGVIEANYYNKGSEATIPSWEIRRFQGGDTISNVIVKSDNTFSYYGAQHPSVMNGTVPADDANLPGKGTTEASVKLSIKNGVATIAFSGKNSTGATYSDTKTFTLGTMAGNHFAISNSGNNNSTGSFDNILVEANDDPVEHKDGKVYIVGGKFASRSGVALFALEDGTYRIENVTMNTHEKKVMNVPENATKMFFWRDLSTVRPLVSSIEF